MNQPMTLVKEDSEAETRPDNLNVGSALKELREARGLSLGEVSARIKYSAGQLAHLEAQHWDRLPEGVPLRGLVRNYARYLDADVDALLRLLDDEVGPTGPRPANVINPSQPMVSADLPVRGEPAHRTWIWLFLILVLLCVAGAYAIGRGWVPEEWLIFDWLKALRQ
ncbi:MAG: helix-turn-helix domain-containing protein [Alcaligenaceae bacterium]|nr:helix-turn-helix domain-containing protein [Alcaligenaceae bacterium]